MGKVTLLSRCSLDVYIKSWKEGKGPGKEKKAGESSKQEGSFLEAWHMQTWTQMHGRTCTEYETTTQPLGKF